LIERNVVGWIDTYGNALRGRKIETAVYGEIETGRVRERERSAEKLKVEK
jgi:hypothetical protein